MFSAALVHGLLQRPFESKRLVLTRAERSELLGLVEKLWGSELAEGQDAVISYPGQAAQILKQFLSDKWLSADSPDSDLTGP